MIEELAKIRKGVGILKKEVKDVFIPKGRDGNTWHEKDIRVSKSEMKKAYQHVLNAFAKYEKEQSDINLAGLSDAITMMSIKHPHVDDGALDTDIPKAFQKTKTFKKIKKELKDVDFTDLIISEDDAYRLTCISLGLKEEEYLKKMKKDLIDLRMPYADSKAPERHGALRIKDGCIEVSTAELHNIHDMSAMSSGNLIESGSHGWWHTHPAISMSGPSKGDLRIAKLWKVPGVVVHYRGGFRPQIHIVDPKGKTHRVKIA